MNFQNTFKRYEIKYLITSKQKEIILNAVSSHILPDKYGHSSICSLYCDTLDNRLIRSSIQRPVYKEKLRLRSYGVPTHNDTIFLELKKKYEALVYKRRISLTEKDAVNYICQSTPLSDTSQIAREIDYFCSFYQGLRPSMLISYERDAFYANDDESFRMTFDCSVTWRNFDLDLTKGIYGNSLLPKDTCLMELKTSSALPLWLVKCLSANNIFKTSFSKYGSAYCLLNQIS